jgi:hypothetical protein
MSVALPYNGTLTAEQFLFYEMRIVSGLYLDGKPIEDIVEAVKRDNLFQYPTERQISRLTRACHKRILALGDERLIVEVATAPVGIAKQINLYSMMRYNRLAREFMVNLIGGKYLRRDYTYTKKDVNVFFSDLQRQNEDVSGWSEKTITKLKQVMTRCIIEIEMIDSVKSESLNPILISEELESGIRRLEDFEALAAFNCVRG